jgi:hypothetical protein
MPMTIAERAEKIKTALAAFKRDGIRGGGKGAIAAVVDYQDLVMRTGGDGAELREIEASMTDEERRLFVWANGCTLDADSFARIFMQTVGRRKILAVYESERGELAEWEKRLDEKEATLRGREAEAKRIVREAEARAEAADEAKERIQERVNEVCAEMTEVRREIHEVNAEMEVVAKANADLQTVKRVLMACAAEAAATITNAKEAGR